MAPDFRWTLPTGVRLTAVHYPVPQRFDDGISISIGYENAVRLLADFTTDELARAIDWQATKQNVMTSGNLERAKLPFTYPTDRESVEAAAFRERAIPINELRVASVRSTLHLRELLVSAPLAEEARGRSDLEVIGQAQPLPFDATGRWVSPFSI